MERLLACAVWGVAVACASNPRSAASSETELFRWIAIGPAAQDTIRLGQPLADSGPYFERTSDSTYRLRPGTFAGADSIEIRVTPEGLVKEMHFTYPPDANWSAMLQTFARTLGPGTHIQMTEARELSRWEDERTRFVVGTGGRAGRRIKAALIDLRLAR